MKSLYFLFLAGCVSISAQEDISKTSDVVLPVPSNIGYNITTPNQSLQMNHKLDVSDEISSLNDIGGEVYITVVENDLTANNGNKNFDGFNEIKVVLHSESNSSLPDVTVIDHLFTKDDTLNQTINIPINQSDNLFKYFQSGAVDVNLILNGDVSTDTPTDYTSTIKIKVQINTSKSL